MFQKEYASVSDAALAKVQFLHRNLFGYFLMSMLAGIYIGVGVLLAFTAGGMLAEFAGAKLVMGACFGVALSLVVMAGGELFTGNNFVMAAGMLSGKVEGKDAGFLWIVCYIGNLCGGLLLAALYHLSGLGSGMVGQFINEAAQAKMQLAPMELFVRGILCNMLVCLAVWAGMKMNSESGKLIMIFWCLLAFFTCGFEHSVANMTLLAVALLRPLEMDLTIGGMVYNLAFVTLGNMIGGICLLAVPYYVAGKEKEE